MGLIKQDPINQFTSQGEKLENPTFGTIIWDVIHDPMTEDLEEAIKQDVLNIINSDPELEPTGVNHPFEQVYR